MKFESGVHRVQRVPTTENSGRVHTSAATVAVLPEAEEVDIKIEEKDLRIDVFRSSGPGGQSVNTTDSAVRVTHIPTGVVVSQQDEKSQHKNKAKALKILRSRVLDKEIQLKDQERAKNRKSQVGTGDRSERIRTYNFPQGRVSDHRINLTLYNLAEILEGQLDELIIPLSAEAESKKLLQFCNLPWDKKCLEFFKRKDLISQTASNIKIRKAIYKDTVKKYQPYKQCLNKYGNKYS